MEEQIIDFVEDTQLNKGESGIGERGIKNNFQDTNTLRDYILDEVGIGETFLTGDKSNPVEVRREDLTDKQVLNIYKYAISRNVPHYDEREKAIINHIRNGTFEEFINDFYNQSQAEPEVYTDEDYFFWKMREDYPEMTDEQIRREFEDLQESDTYDLKINRIKQAYNDIVQEYNDAIEYQQRQELAEQVEEDKNLLVDILNNKQEFYHFEIPRQVKERVLRNIFESDDNETSRFIANNIDNPEGLLNTALAVEMLPLIVEEYKMLLDELDSLKNQRNFIETGSLDFYSPEDNFGDFDAEGFAKFLK